ncbi:quaternary amine ABC transporter ATP-binding protein [Lutibaculum baratangense]|uniref:quaternary amine ABC transporter ATP-binding protein n=1 Tax=Lutibaculum baratangense TaxID=1358440 RepID=UPI00058C7D25|nr:glycine betaine/L-proline ABC transporter ATP-binding protein [Lutibaculum baratangense]
MTERVRIENLYKIFGDSPQEAVRLLRSGKTKDELLASRYVVGLNDVSISVPAGSIFMVMGLSGSGKSTLARCINRLIEPDAGRILIDGEDVTRADAARLREIRRSRVSMVFQHFALLPHRTVAENAEFGLKMRGLPARERREKARRILEVVGLAAWENHRPAELSGGMRQRVGLARALATEADVLIMDEAFSALDPLIRNEMQDELLRLQQVLKKTILFITHDFQEAIRLGTRIAIMADGAVVQEGTAQEIVLSPNNDYVAAFTRHIDRTRVFDAASVMSPAEPIVLSGDGTVVEQRRGGLGPAYATDPEGRILGYYAPEDLDSLSETREPKALLRKDFSAVRSDAKLFEVAPLCRSQRPVAVVDENGRLCGRIEADSVLAWIGNNQTRAS